MRHLFGVSHLVLGLCVLLAGQAVAQDVGEMVAAEPTASPLEYSNWFPRNPEDK